MICDALVAYTCHIFRSTSMFCDHNFYRSFNQHCNFCLLTEKFIKLKLRKMQSTGEILKLLVKYHNLYR